MTGLRDAIAAAVADWLVGTGYYSASYAAQEAPSAADAVLSDPVVAAALGAVGRAADLADEWDKDYGGGCPFAADLRRALAGAGTDKPQVTIPPEGAFPGERGYPLAGAGTEPPIEPRERAAAERMAEQITASGFPVLADTLLAWAKAFADPAAPRGAAGTQEAQ